MLSCPEDGHKWMVSRCSLCDCGQRGMQSAHDPSKHCTASFPYAYISASKNDQYAKHTTRRASQSVKQIEGRTDGQTDLVIFTVQLIHAEHDLHAAFP